MDSLREESSDWEGSQLDIDPVNEWEAGSLYEEAPPPASGWEGQSQFPPPPSHPPPTGPSLNDFYPHVDSFDLPPPAEVYPPQPDVYLTHTEVDSSPQFEDFYSPLSDVNPASPQDTPLEYRDEASNDYQFQYLAPPVLEERIDIGEEDYNEGEDQGLPDLAQLAWIVESNLQNYIFNPQVASLIISDSRKRNRTRKKQFQETSGPAVINVVDLEEGAVIHVLR